jgi:hypothetical protein
VVGTGARSGDLANMAFKPNYNQQRAERNRAKQAKQEAKQREQEEARARRKAAQAAADAGGETATPEADDKPAG